MSRVVDRKSFGLSKAPAAAAGQPASKIAPLKKYSVVSSKTKLSAAAIKSKKAVHVIPSSSASVSQQQETTPVSFCCRAPCDCDIRTLSQGGLANNPTELNTLFEFLGGSTTAPILPAVLQILGNSNCFSLQFDTLDILKQVLLGGGTPEFLRDIEDLTPGRIVVGVEENQIVPDGTGNVLVGQILALIYNIGERSDDECALGNLVFNFPCEPYSDLNGLTVRRFAQLAVLNLLSAQNCPCVGTTAAENAVCALSASQTATIADRINNAFKEDGPLPSDLCISSKLELSVCKCAPSDGSECAAGLYTVVLGLNPECAATPNVFPAGTTAVVTIGDDTIATIGDLAGEASFVVCLTQEQLSLPITVVLSDECNCTVTVTTGPVCPTNGEAEIALTSYAVTCNDDGEKFVSIRFTATLDGEAIPEGTTFVLSINGEEYGPLTSEDGTSYLLEDIPFSDFIGEDCTTDLTIEIESEGGCCPVIEATFSAACCDLIQLLTCLDEVVTPPAAASSASASKIFASSKLVKKSAPSKLAKKIAPSKLAKKIAPSKLAKKSAPSKLAKKIAPSKLVKKIAPSKLVPQAKKASPLPSFAAIRKK